MKPPRPPNFGWPCAGSAVEQHYLNILAAVGGAVTIPVAVKLGPCFIAFGHIAQALDRARANALVLFNRFYQWDNDQVSLRTLKVIALSRARKSACRCFGSGCSPPMVPVGRSCAVSALGLDDGTPLLLIFDKSRILTQSGG